MTLPAAVAVCALVLALVLPTWPVAAQVPAPDDAGSGRDAGTSFGTAVPIQPGVRYTASLNNGPAGDFDWFTFEARRGQVINAAVSDTNAAGCMWIYASDDSVLADGGCGDTISDVLVPADGTYALRYGYVVVDEASYEFGVGLGGPAPFDVDLGTPSDPAVEQRPGQVVVAVADSGVNPYHEIYHRPGNTAHPCTWVEGFDDCSVPALELSIGEHDTVAEAYAADRDVWTSIEPHRWYWIPRTNIIGAVCEGSEGSTPPEVCIFDDDGHGTGTTSSVLTEAPDALLLVHEGSAGAFDMASAPVVPDIQSHSWGSPAPVPLHLTDPAWVLLGGYPFADPGAVDPETVFFIAAGNGAPFPTALDVNRVHPDVQVVGGGYPGHWTPHSWATFDFASWFCRPSALHDGRTAVRPSHCGTSLAAPTAAGTAAAALLEIRRQEGTTARSTADMVSTTVSREDFIAALRAGATYDPEPGRFHNQPRPEDGEIVNGQEHLSWGYGWLDATRVDAIVACAMEDVCPAKSAEAEEYNQRRQDLRRTSTGGMP